MVKIKKGDNMMIIFLMIAFGLALLTLGILGFSRTYSVKTGKK